MAKVVLMKLTTGEEVIARVSTNFVDGVIPDSTVTVESVRAIMMQPTQTGEVGIALIPWMAGAGDKTITIKDEHIVAQITDIPKQLEDAYLEQTSGLQFANSTTGINIPGQ